ncbi:hypothetical protein [Flavobacterium sp. 3HN19-14]|uniref:hypothetical protein n=1 Tax=Flavobacterium sp. 3HN19-14 TaxID=3448133 RepID=UPI003EE0A8B7
MPRLITFGLLPVVLVAIFSFLLNVNLPGYMVSGYQLVSGYNAIMYDSYPEFKNIQLSSIFISILAIIFLLLTLARERKNYTKSALILFMLAAGLFILYKQSFVRADAMHVFDFVKYIAILLLCIQDFVALKAIDFRNLLMVVIVSLTAYIGIVNLKPFDTNSQLKWNKSGYITGFKKFTSVSGVNLYPNDNQLPAKILSKVGNNTTDTFPWDIHLLFENGLNYQPRPVLQAYSAYTKQLENLNFDFYNSEKAPKFVIYDVASLDGRYMFLDEPKVSLILLRNYKVSDSFLFQGRKLLLLEKEDNAKPVTLEFVKEYEQPSSAPLVPEEGCYYEVELKSSIKGKLISVFDHAPSLQLKITTEDNHDAQFRTSTQMLASGLFYNKRIMTTDDFIENNDNIKPSAKIKQYGFVPENPAMFGDNVTIRQYKISPEKLVQ